MDDVCLSLLQSEVRMKARSASLQRNVALSSHAPAALAGEQEFTIPSGSSRHVAEDKQAVALQQRVAVSPRRPGPTADEIQQAMPYFDLSSARADEVRQPHSVDLIDLLGSNSTLAKDFWATYNRARAGELFGIEWGVWKLMAGLVGFAIFVNLAAMAHLLSSGSEGKAAKSGSLVQPPSAFSAAKSGSLVLEGIFSRAWGQWTPTGDNFGCVRMKVDFECMDRRRSHLFGAA